MPCERVLDQVAPRAQGSLRTSRVIILPQLVELEVGERSFTFSRPMLIAFQVSG